MQAGRKKEIPSNKERTEAMKIFTTVIVFAAVVVLALAPAAPAHAGKIVTDFSNFSESGPLVGNLEQSFTPSAADVTIAYDSGSGAGYEWFLSDEFPTPAAGDRISVDWDGAGSFAGNDGFGVAITSTANPTSRVNMFNWFMEPGKPELALESFDGAGGAGTFRVFNITPPDTLFIDRTATGWSFGSITGGTETVHLSDVNSVDGSTITADGSALGLFSTMHNSTSSWTVSNLTVVVPEPSSLALSVAASDSNLIFTWDSAAGILYNLLSDPGLATDPAGWPVWDGHQNIEATPPENTLTISRPADPERFFVVESGPAPPFVALTDDFESGPGDWTTGSDGDGGTAWELGAPSGVGPAAAHSPTNCFGTNIGGDYAINAEVWLRSPEIDLIEAVGATLTYFQAYDIEAGFDSGAVRVLDSADDSELAVLFGDVAGNAPGWAQVTRALPAAARGKTIKIEFRLTSDDFENFPGWYIDDFQVTIP
jgi:hypothetical protein